ncbi:transporter, NhaC family [Neorhodopirellula lusitana]|uniref:Transporter, NhaC family n=1 Tax=Neorhodopirellula lusitana TaxID=445327 RepID=A0ABY1Q1B1_9BACT|nr:Na+/H+ antiporter NhaC family protein [Neorhodopirellula lusitana]SMP56234.1 transporter, NhaC family [Neorhodopirellula lusitana]
MNLNPPSHDPSALNEKGKRKISVGRIAALVACVGVAVSFAVGKWGQLEQVTEKIAIEQVVEEGEAWVVVDEEKVTVRSLPIWKPSEAEALTAQELSVKGYRDSEDQAVRIVRSAHYRWWSFLPALMAVAMCLLTKEPIISLLAGVVSGGLLLGRYNIVDEVLMPSLASVSGAGILLLYLWLLGALMGIWSRNGAAEAFANWATRHFVRGPRSAKLVAWGLGVLFFQGGAISTVLVGTTVRPVADRQRISHEELSYIVDSTASPIAILLAFNAWPLYVQTLIFVPGVACLATEADRLSFFFGSLPFSFYAWFAILGTFLLTVEKAPFLGKRMRAAMERSRTTGQLDRPGSEPMLSTELQASQTPEGYVPSVLEFVLPLTILTGIAVGSFWISGAPEVRVAFAVAVVVAAITSLIRGMSLTDLMLGINNGLKGVVVASVILLLAVTLGGITRETGAAYYLTNGLGDSIPYLLLPGMLFVLTVAIAFSTGTSWGTYAVAFPLAMPLAISVAGASDLSDPQRFLAICFASVLNGSVMGDQCSPISDTTVLSSMTTGADLMDHVLTQAVPAMAAAAIALILWTLLTLTC